MIKSLSISLALFLLLILTMSDVKGEDNSWNYVDVDVTILNSKIYTYTFTGFTHADEVELTKVNQDITTTVVLTSDNNLDLSRFNFTSTHATGIKLLAFTKTTNEEDHVFLSVRRLAVVWRSITEVTTNHLHMFIPLVNHN